MQPKLHWDDEIAADLAAFDRLLDLVGGMALASVRLGDTRAFEQCVEFISLCNMFRDAVEAEHAAA